MGFDGPGGIDGTCRTDAGRPAIDEEPVFEETAGKQPVVFHTGNFHPRRAGVGVWVRDHGSECAGYGFVENNHFPAEGIAGTADEKHKPLLI